MHQHLGTEAIRVKDTEVVVGTQKLDGEATGAVVAAVESTQAALQGRWTVAFGGAAAGQGTDGLGCAYGQLPIDAVISGKPEGGSADQ